MSYQIGLRHYKYFLAVAEELHFKKAADKLFISQPGLSKQIKEMEEALGFKLFERNNRNVVLTAAGKYLKEEITLLLNDNERILRHAQHIATGNEGEIHLGYVGSAMQTIIPKLLIRFRKKYPSIHFSLQEMDNNRQINDLLGNKIDIGFVRLNEVPKALSLRPVFDETFSLVLPKNHALNSRNFTSLNQLKAEQFIFFEKAYSPSYHEKVISMFEDCGFSPTISHTSVHATTIYRLVENSFGVAIVPSSLKLGYNMNIKFIELKNVPQRAVLSLAWNKENRNPMLRHFLDV
ncbi:MAG: LysR family transcriptional regulator [Flavobacteriales bacterium]|nr:LysR family transcriptional regulator [Flavobacteriales bacterium]